MTNSSYFPTQLQAFQFADKYARWNNDKLRRETWDESVARAVAYLIELSEDKLSNEDYTSIYNAMLNMEAFSSMRLFAMAGEAARRCNSVLYNCSYIAIDSVRAFSEILYLSMSGTGVGFSVEKEFVNKLPVIGEYRGNPSKDFPPTWVIEDSQEGWAEAFHLGLTTWFSGFDCQFDYSKIRPIGTVLKTKGGRASGPDPLKKLLDYSREIIIGAQGRQLRPIEVHDIVCMIGDCAVSGGSRRSAMISLFDRNDKEMLHAKDYGWWKTHPQRANANNSVVIDDHLTRNDVRNIMETMHNGGGGEPGFYMRKNAGKMAPRRTFVTKPGTNPCQPAFAKVLTREGETELSFVDVGDEIFSQDGWVTVVRKFSQGIKPVHVYSIDGYGVFVGTDDHKILTQYGGKVEIGYAERKEIPIPVLDERTGNIEYRVIDNFQTIGDYEVFSITVDGEHHTYWTGGLSVCNCGEIDLNSRQFCNLSQAIVRADDTQDTLKEKVRVATIIGTIQSMATKFKYISPEWKENTARDRLLGVDITGQHDHPTLITSEFLDELREYAIDANKKYATILGINQSVSLSCSKPSGNSSILFNCAPGIHSQWSDYYIRRVRVNANSPMRHTLEQSGFILQPENGQQYDTATTLVAEFPVKAPDGAITNGERGAIEQCEWWKMNKIHWTEHNPSVTISYVADELPDLIDWIYDNQNIIGGMSFLEKDNHYYPLAPYEAIDKETYEKMLAELPEINFDLLKELEHEDQTSVAQEVACVGGVCLI